MVSRYLRAVPEHDDLEDVVLLDSEALATVLHGGGRGFHYLSIFN